MSTPPPVREPDEVLTLHGDDVAHWGQVGFVKVGEPVDPIPSVYASHGEIETGEYRFDVDQAEAYAQRILNAARWQRGRDADQRAAELNAMATDAAATHDWRPADGSAECSRCGCVVRVDDFLTTGVVPTCGTRCPMSWHDIGTALAPDQGDAVCIHCQASWSSAHLYVLRDVEGHCLPVGPFLTFDRALAVMEEGGRFVPMRYPRDEAIAAVAAHVLPGYGPVAEVSPR